MSDQPSGRRDFNQAAHGTIQTIIDRTEPPAPVKNLAAVALGKLGGLKGGRLGPRSSRRNSGGDRVEGEPARAGEPRAGG